MQARTRRKLALFRRCMGSDADNAAKHTVAGNKTARNVFKGQCAENRWRRRKRGRVPGASSARSATLLGAVAPVSKPKLMIRLSQFSAAEQISLINQT